MTDCRKQSCAHGVPYYPPVLSGNLGGGSIETGRRGAQDVLLHVYSKWNLCVARTVGNRIFKVRNR